MSSALREVRSDGPLGESLAAMADGQLDRALAARAAQGDAGALEALVTRHQPWVFAVALRMLGNRSDAAETTQEVMLKIVTRLSQYRGESRFRTWAYRLAANTVLDAAKARRRRTRNFTEFAAELDATGNEPLSLPPDQEPDRALLLEETRMRCMTGMMLCLSPEQRLVYILGDLFDVNSTLGAELLEIQAATFRKRLARARADIGHFVFEQCGLVDARNPCRCPGKTSRLMKQGLVDPNDLVFSERGWKRAKRDALPLAKSLAGAQARFRALLADQPLTPGPDVLMELRSAMNSGLDGL